MNIDQLTNAIQKDLDQVANLDQQPIIEVMKTIMGIAEKHAKEITRPDLWEYITDLSLDDKSWKKVMVLRVCTLQDAIREAMIISACDITWKG
jgi:hypothetical protein